MEKVTTISKKTIDENIFTSEEVLKPEFYSKENIGKRKTFNGEISPLMSHSESPFAPKSNKRVSEEVVSISSIGVSNVPNKMNK